MTKPASLFVVFVSVIFLAEHETAAFPSATFCRICDTHDPNAGDDCYQTLGSQHKTCMGGCITRFSMTLTGLRIQKSCTDDAACLVEWWLSSSTRSVCQEDKLSRPEPTLPAHVTCSVCCHAARDGDIHCSDRVYPPASTLIQYSDVPRPTPSSLSDETTEVDDEYDPIGHTNGQPDWATKQDLIAPEDAEKYPEPMVCANCKNIDQEDHSSCGASTVCYGSKPLCMTSFFDDGQLHLREVKRCAAVSECWDLWYNKTRLRQDCMGDEDHDPYSWDGTKSGECHYCCHTPEGESSDWCNKPMWPTKPRNLVDMVDYQHRILDPKRTTMKATTTNRFTTEKSTTEVITEATTTEQATTDQVTTERVTTQKVTDAQTTVQATTEEVKDAHTTEQATTQKMTDAQTTEQATTQKKMDAQTTEQATTEQVTDAHTTEQATTQKKMDAQTTEQATTQKKMDAQTTEQATTQKKMDAQTTEQATTQKKMDAQTTEQATTEQVTDAHTTEQATTQKKMDAQTTEQATTQKKMYAQTTEQATTEQVTDAQTTEQASTQRMTDAQIIEQSTTQQMKDAQTTKEATTEQVTDSQTTEQASTQRMTDAQTTEQAIPDHITDTQTTVQASTEQVTDSQITEQATRQKVTDVQTTAQASTENATHAQTTEQETRDNVLIVQTTEENPTEEMTDAQTTDQAFTDQMTRVKSTEQATTEQVTDPQTTKLTSKVSQPNLKCQVCEASSNKKSSCYSGRIETCPDGQDYCINTVTFELSQDGSQANSISKKCASYQTCLSSNINIGVCSGDLTDPTAFSPGTSCNFCCNETLPSGVPCNANIRPDNTISFLPKITPAPVSSRSCLQCGDPVSGKPCGPGDLLLGMSQPCPANHNFCMNDIYEKAGDGKTIYKRCVDEAECKNKWFKESSDSPECTEYNPRGSVTSDLTCHFCCTSDGCNIPTKPVESTLWTPFFKGN
ncbi:hypothetical protein RRG08_047501 [Elysia crispata]|uniref:Uncharacterized protein n=1 Tax=Elysia crispata TaxID=231223 RepID=A0AAE0XXZ9_9GAST|nr:hypothetical protein RRG08_047501 [Elysia crispata]